MPGINELLAKACSNGASDLHLEAGTHAFIRVAGDSITVTDDCLSADEIQNFLYVIMTEDQRLQYAARREIEFGFNFDDTSRFRVLAYYRNGLPAAIFHMIPQSVKPANTLPDIDVIRQIANLPKGMVLVTGLSGSGKSTTVAAIIECINQNQVKDIVTIEQPIEFIHRSKKSRIIQNELTCDSGSFSEVMKDAIKMGTDVISVGETIDQEAISLALTAAETGSLVIGTFYTQTASETLLRLLHAFPDEEKAMIRSMLSETLQAIISQDLIEDSNGKRVAIQEVVFCTPEVRRLILDNELDKLDLLT